MRVNFFYEFLIFITFLLVSFLIVQSFGYTMLDDGWRHLAMALYPNEIQSWGDIYLKSLFSDYDPWFTWHLFLRFIGEIFGDNNIVLITNTIIYFLLSLWYYLVFQKFLTINKPLSILLSCLLPLLSTRYLFLRPDAFSGLFVLYSIFFSSWFFVFVISIFYAYIYYVYWFFMGFIGYVKLMTKEYKAMFAIGVATLIGTIFYLYNDLDGFVHITKLILSNDSLRENYQVGEGKPYILPLSLVNTYGSSLILGFLMLISILIFFVFKPQNKILQYIVLLFPLMIIQVRFFIILQPLIIVFSIYLVYQSYVKIINTSFLLFVEDITIKIKTFINERTLFGNLNPRIYKLIIALVIVVYFLNIYYTKQGLYTEVVQEKLDNISFINSDEFNNKNIFLTSWDTDKYMMVYKNPTSKYFPSCALGWVDLDKDYKDDYFKLLMNTTALTPEEFFELVIEHDADYIMIPPSGTNTSINFDTSSLSQYGYIFYKIINGYVIFKKIDS